MTREENIKRFEELLLSVNREGVEDLLSFIRKSDFYTAPASTKYHLNCEGGLLQHSLNVYDRLSEISKNGIWAKYNFETETIIVSALLHDLCKTFMYVSEIKNRKVYSEYGSKSDSQGRYDWESYLGYTIEDRFPMGHGCKSVIMCEQYIKLTPEERYAILWHMGFTVPKEEYNTLSAAMSKYPIVLAISEADLEATYLLEGDNDGERKTI